MPRHYNQSTRDVIRDLTIGMHVKTTDSVLTALKGYVVHCNLR